MKKNVLFALLVSVPTVTVADCIDHKSNQALIAGYSVNLRVDPTITANVIDVFHLGAKVDVLEHGKCETIAGKLGRWVKVKIWRPCPHCSDGSSFDAYKEVGWLFDAYIAYPDMFKSGNKWHDFNEWSLGGGDYIETYTFGSGTFTHQIPKEGEWKYERGFVFSFGRILMLSNSQDQPRELTGHYIFRDRNSNFCTIRGTGEITSAYSLSPGMDGTCDPEFARDYYVR